MRQSNVATHLVAWNFLLLLVGIGALSSSLDNTLQRSADKVTLQAFEIFNRQNISGAAGIYEFLNDTVNKSDGICNVDKGVLPQNQAFVFNGVSISYATELADKEGAAAYGAAAPAALRNAEFTIVQNGREVVNLPVASLTNPFTANSTSERDNWYVLPSMAYLTDNEYFDMKFKFPKGVSIAAAVAGADGNHYAEVRLAGHRTVKKAA